MANETVLLKKKTLTPRPALHTQNPNPVVEQQEDDATSHQLKSKLQPSVDPRDSDSESRNPEDGSRIVKLSPNKTPEKKVEHAVKNPIPSLAQTADTDSDSACESKTHAQQSELSSKSDDGGTSIAEVNQVDSSSDDDDDVLDDDCESSALAGFGESLELTASKSSSCFLPSFEKGKSINLPVATPFMSMTG